MILYCIFWGRFMKVVICDDSLRDLSNIEKILLTYQSNHSGTYFDIEKFSDASVLSKRIEENQLADIYLLDMIMMPTTGLDLGRQLRSLGNESAIIYITTSDDFALDAYSVHAIRYLLKPISQEKLFEAIDYALAYTKISIDTPYLLKTREGLVTIPHSKIEYIENVSRTLEIHRTDGKVLKGLFIRRSFEEEIGSLLEERRFIQVHKSFLVNLNYVQQLSKNCIIMESGTYIPVSQKRAATVKNEYLSFVTEYYR